MAVLAAIGISGCGFPRSTVTIAGLLDITDRGECVYVHGPDDGITDLYWLRSLPAGYAAGSEGIDGPGGVHYLDGQMIDVTGELGGTPGDTICVNVHTFYDVTRISGTGK